MKKGCLIGCLVAAALFVMAVVALVWGLASAFDVYSPKERVALAGVYGGSHGVIVAFDPNNEALIATLDEVFSDASFMTKIVLYALPHEFIVIGDADASSATRSITVAASTKRLGKWLHLILSDPGRWDAGEEYEVKEVTLRDDGVLYGVAEGRIPPAALEEAEKHWWRARSQGTSLQGGHMLEVVLDNSAGQAFLMLESQAMSAEVAGEKVDEYLDEDTLSTLFFQVATVRITADMPERDLLLVNVDLTSPSSEAGAAVEMVLDPLFDDLVESLAEDGIQVQGEFERDRHEIHGVFRVTGFEAQIMKAAREATQQ